jgi:hypothetical protein
MKKGYLGYLIELHARAILFLTLLHGLLVTRWFLDPT